MKNLFITKRVKANSTSILNNYSSRKRLIERLCTIWKKFQLIRQPGNLSDAGTNRDYNVDEYIQGHHLGV